MKTAEKVIGNHTYRVTALGALKGRSVFIMLVRIMGGAADGLAGNNVPAALTQVAANLTDADLAFLCDTFGKVTDVVLPDGRAPKLSDIFDLHFSDNYLEMVEWLVFSLEVNFSSFFKGLAGKLGNGASAMPVTRPAP